MSADIIDRRQRVAASLILTAVDFPVDMGAYAKLLSQAGRIVGKGASAAEASSASRLEGLTRAKALIDQMLEESA